MKSRLLHILLLTAAGTMAPSASAQEHVSAPPAERAPQAVRAMTVTLLGTAGGPQARVARSQPATLITVDGANYLFDVGAGTLRQLALAGLTANKLDTVFISHLHTDHTAGLPALTAFRWSYQMTGQKLPPLPILGPPGTEEMMRGAVQFATIPTETLRAQSPNAPKVSTTTQARNVLPGVVFDDGRIKVTAVENSHYDTVPIGDTGHGKELSYSYRIDSKYGSVLFTGDTGPSEAVVQLANGTDLLVSEIIDIPAVVRFIATNAKLPVGAEAGIVAHMEREHLSPEEVGKLARAAGVGKVLLTHIANPDLTPGEEQALAKGVAEEFGGPVILGQDLMTMAVGSDSAD